MNEFFLKVINMSIAASWLVLAVLILRILLKKVPRWIHALLWGIVAVRLLFPFSIESVLSLIPSAQTIPINIEMDTTPAIHSGIDAINSVVNPMISRSNTPVNGTSVNPLQITISVFANIWILGMAALLIYTAVSYWKLRRKVGTAVLFRDNVFQSENVASPFVLGILKPRIYVPFKLGSQDLKHVVAHEQAHIRRKDHWWKPLGFLLLTIHWFNPLMWLGYVLLCRDIEFACDEKVIKELENDQRADYTQALLGCSVGRHTITACPLAFGEVGVKERVKSVMNYQKPAFWLVVLAIVLCVAVAVCFLTNPKNDEPDVLPLLHSHSYSVVEVTYEPSNISFSMVAQQNTPIYAITDTMQLMSKGEHSAGDEWTALGTLLQTELTKENFDQLFYGAGHWFGKETASVIRKNTANAWALIYDQDALYYVLQQKNGEVYLARGYYDYSEKNDPGSDDTNILWLFKLAYDLTEDTGIIATSGTNVVPVAVFPYGTPIADMKDSIQWLDIVPGADAFVPFTVVCDGEEQYGWYGIYDAQTLDALDFVRPSGLAPQTYLFQNAQYGHDYIITLSTNGKDLLCFGARIGDAHSGTDTVQWFDYTDDMSSMDWDNEITIEIPEFPGVTFRYTPYRITASKPFGSTDTDEPSILIDGTPIWNAYFCDLTGDGLPELCASLSVGSGIIDNRVIIHDYANGVSYALEDRAHFDYYLHRNEEDGCLYVDKKDHMGGTLISTGRLFFDDGCVQFGYKASDIKPEMTFEGLEHGQEKIDAEIILIPADGATLNYHLTYSSATIILEIGLISDDGTEMKRTVKHGSDHGTIDDIPAGQYQLFVRNMGKISGSPGDTVKSGAMVCSLNSNG